MYSNSAATGPNQLCSSRAIVHRACAAHTHTHQRSCRTVFHRSPSHAWVISSGDHNLSPGKAVGCVGTRSPRGFACAVGMCALPHGGSSGQLTAKDVCVFFGTWHAGRLKSSFAVAVSALPAVRVSPCPLCVSCLMCVCARACGGVALQFLQSAVKTNRHTRARNRYFLMEH